MAYTAETTLIVFDFGQRKALKSSMQNSPEVGPFHFHSGTGEAVVVVVVVDVVGVVVVVVDVAVVVVVVVEVLVTLISDSLIES